MTDSLDPEEFTDINEVVSDEWEAETTPYERVREVISHVYTPESADNIAETALTSPKTARKHLTALAEEGFVETESGSHGGTLYRRSSESLVVEQAADILDNVSRAELTDRIAEMRHTIREFQNEYDAESPQELVVAETNRAFTETDSEQDDIDPETLTEWQTTRRNLAFATAALSIANAEQFVDEASAHSDWSVPVQ